MTEAELRLPAIVNGYDAIAAILRDPRFSTDRSGWDDEFAFGPLEPVMRRWLVFTDPPDHTRLRKLVSRAFTPRAIAAIQPEVDRTAVALIDALAPAGRFDVVHEYAYPLAIGTIARLLGVPDADVSRFHEWAVAIARVVDPPPLRAPEDDARIEAAAGPFVDYLRALIAKRRADPGDDVLSGMIAARDDDDRLSEEELLATASMILWAGFETTANLIGNGMLALLEHPETLAAVRRDPEMVDGVVEELLRRDGPVQVAYRTAREDVVVDGIEIEAGQGVLLMLTAANRDAARFDAPHTLRTDRPDREHLAFGVGPHFCLGAHLARLEARTGIATLVTRLPSLRLDGAPEWRDTVFLRGLAAFSVRCD